MFKKAPMFTFKDPLNRTMDVLCTAIVVGYLGFCGYVFYKGEDVLEKPKSEVERVLEQYGAIDRGEELSNFLKDYRSVRE